MSNGVAVKERLRETVRRWRLFEGTDSLLVAVSGGIDSVVLLHVVLNLPPGQRPAIRVAHFNHRLRGKQSEDEAKFVKDLCRQWGVPCVTARAPVWTDRSNLEARARTLRYRFLEKSARKFGVRKIVTAHHADDQAETFLIRWIQGAGLKGLGGIGVRRKTASGLEILRPLLFVPRREIEAYARSCGLPCRHDPTNRSSLFLRSRLRKLLVGLKIENPNLGTRAAVNSVFLRADEAYLTEVVEEFFAETVERHPKRVALSLSAYRDLPEALRYRILQRMARELQSNEYALPAEAVLKTDEILRDLGMPKRYDLPSALGLSKTRGSFELFRKA